MRHYALETRSDSLKLVAAAAVRRGESDRVEIGRAVSSDAVAGLETLDVGGQLVERAHLRTTQAERLETQIDGKLSSQGRSDTTLLGGALTETYAGATLVLAGMSDDLVVGGGVRASACTLLLSGLSGGEERIGTTGADGALLEAYGTHFEREYGNGSHVAGFARFSGLVHATAAAGFRPLFKVARGVRNLTAGAGGGGADAPSGPTPPPAAATAGLLGEAPEAASASDGAFEPFLILGAADDMDGLAADGARGADTADAVGEARHMTLADVDDTLAQLRARAGLPDESGMEEVFDFLRRLEDGQVGDEAARRAGRAVAGEIRQASAEFQDVLLARGLHFDDLTLQETRALLAHEADIARDAGDLNLAAELQGLLIGFDATVYRNTVDFLDRFPAVADAETLLDLPMSLPPRLVDAPPSSPLGAGLDPADVALQLEEMRSDLLDDFVPLDPLADGDAAGDRIRQRNAATQARADLVTLALDEVRRGNDPMAALDAQVEQARLRESSAVARFEGEAQALEEVTERVRLLTDDRATLDLINRPDVYDALRVLDERTYSTRVAADWDPHRWLSQAGDELASINEQFRPLLEQRLSPEDAAAIDYRNSATVRDALVSAQRSAANRDELLHLTETIRNYDNLVLRVTNDALGSVDEAVGRTSAWPWQVDQDALIDALQREAQRHADAIGDSIGTGPQNEAEVIKTNQDYLNVYHQAVKNIQDGRNPLGFMDEEIRFMEYHVRFAENAAYRAQLRAGEPGLSAQDVQRALDQVRQNRAKAVGQQARLDRLLDARNAVYGAMQTHAAEDLGAFRTGLGALDSGPASLEDATTTNVAGAEPWDATWRAGQGDEAGVGSGLAATEDAGTLRYEGVSLGSADGMVDLSTDDARRVDDRGLGEPGYETDGGLPWGDEPDPLSGYETADSWLADDGRFAGYETAGFDTDGDYPQFPSTLGRDVDVDGLRGAISDARDALPGADEARRRALSLAADAVSRREDPTAVINDAIASMRLRSNTDPALGQDQVDLLVDVHALLDGLLDQHRNANSHARFQRLDETQRVDALRTQVAAWSGQPRPYEVPLGNPPTRAEFVNRQAGQAGFGLDISRHDYEEITEYADLPLNIRDGEVDAAEHTYAAVRERRWPNRQVHEADPRRAGPPAVLRVRDDDLVRVVGFLQAEGGVDDPFNGLPLISVTRAEQMAIADGDITVKVIDATTRQEYRGYRLVANRPDGIDGGVSRRLSPQDLIRAVAKEHDDYIKRHATRLRQQWGPMPLPPDARYPPVALGADGVFRPIDMLPP